MSESWDKIAYKFKRGSSSSNSNDTASGYWKMPESMRQLVKAKEGEVEDHIETRIRIEAEREYIREEMKTKQEWIKKTKKEIKDAEWEVLDMKRCEDRKSHTIDFLQSEVLAKSAWIDKEKAKFPYEFPQFARVDPHE